MIKNIFRIFVVLFLVTTINIYSYTIRDSLTIIKTGDSDTAKITNERMDIDTIYSKYINVDSIWAKYLNIHNVDTAKALKFETNDSKLSGLFNYNSEDTSMKRIGTGNIFYDSFITLNASNWDIDTTGTAYIHADDSLEIYTLDKPDTAILTSKKLLRDSTEVTFRICKFGDGGMTAVQNIYFKNLGQDILLSSLTKDYAGGSWNYIDMIVYDKNGQAINSVKDTCEGNLIIKFTRYMDTVYSYINDSIVAKTNYDLYSGNVILDSNYIRFKFVGDDEFPYFYIDDFSIDTFIIAIDTILPDNEIKMFHKDNVVFEVANDRFHFLPPYIPDTTRFAYQNPWFNVYNFADTLSDSNIIWNYYNEDMTSLGVPDKITIINIYGGKCDTLTINALTLYYDTLSIPLVINFYGDPISRDTFYMQDIKNRKIIISGHREFVINNYTGCLNIFNTRGITLNNCRFYNKRGNNKTAYALQFGGTGTIGRKIEINNCYIESDSTVLGYSGALNFNNLQNAQISMKNTTIYAHGINSSEGSAVMITGCADTFNFYDCNLITDFDCLNGIIDGGYGDALVNIYSSRLIAKNNQLGQLAGLADWGLNIKLYNSYIETQTGGFWTYRYHAKFSHIEIHNCYVKTRHFALRPSYGCMKAYNSTFYSTDKNVHNDTGQIWITPAGDNSNLSNDFRDSLIIDGCKFIGHGIKPILFSKATNDDLAHDSLLARVYLNIKNTEFISNRDTLIYTSTYTRDSFNIDLENITYNTMQDTDATYENLSIVEDTTSITNTLKTKNGIFDKINTKTAVVDSNLTTDSLYARTAVFNGLVSQTGLGYSTYFGDSAGINDDKTDNANVGIGFQALYTSTNGIKNVAIGKQSLYSNTCGLSNVAIGYRSLYSNTMGEGNMAIGSFSLYDNTTGCKNIGIGFNALRDNIEGYYNIGIGYESGYCNSDSGYKNVFIGAFANAMADGDTNTIVIGANATGAGDNTATIGDTSIIKTVLRGKVLADSIKSDSINTDIIRVESTAYLKNLYCNNDKYRSIFLKSLLTFANGRINSDTIFIGTDTIRGGEYERGAVFFDTTDNKIKVFDGLDWGAECEIYVNGLDTVTVSAQNTWYTTKIWTQGEADGLSLIGDSVVVIKKQGIYDIEGHLSCSSETANHTFQWGISVNSAVPNVKTRGMRKFANTDFGNLASGCKLDLSINDTLRMVVMDTTGTADLYVKYGNLKIEGR